MSISNLPLDGLPTPPAPMKGSRSEPGGLNIDCTSGSMPSAVPMQQTLSKSVHFVASTCMKITNPMLGHPDFGSPVNAPTTRPRH
ncbi:hypothetical protein HaLaN_11101, partial [Haematococcus lacustris]